jgi:4-hydroxy-2-oxoheptanedioate aldolase
MHLPKNLFKERLRSGTCQLGMWNTAGGNTIPELLAGAGYDWVLVDCEHSAIETVEVLPALQAIGQYPDVAALARPAENSPVLFKRLLDMGAQTLLVPYVETEAEAQMAVSAMHYGPAGMRGMAGMTRATRYGQVNDYFETAASELCLCLQIETKKGLDNLESIAKTDGVDALFFGPADLSASLGVPGQTDHPKVIEAIDAATEKLNAWNVPWGTLCLNPPLAKEYIKKGAAFVAVGVDLVLLAQSVAALRKTFEPA